MALSYVFSMFYVCNIQYPEMAFTLEFMQRYALIVWKYFVNVTLPCLSAPDLLFVNLHQTPLSEMYKLKMCRHML